MSIACYKCSYPYCQGHTAPYMICGGSSADVYAGIATRPAPQLTEADVRRIVREEIDKERAKSASACTMRTCATCGKPEDDCTCTATTIQRLRAERDALRARANENELCAAAVVEIRRVCAEIMGGNMAFVDDDFARCLLTLRDERDVLAKENAAIRALLAECREHVIEGRDRALRHEAYYAGYPSRVARAKSEGAACDALLARIDAAVKS